MLGSIVGGGMPLNLIGVAISGTLVPLRRRLFEIAPLWHGLGLAYLTPVSVSL
jgi:hypothetical protein